MHSEWKIALAAWVTLSGWRVLRELGPMYWRKREGLWAILLTRAAVVLAGWAAFHLWQWAVAGVAS